MLTSLSAGSPGRERRSCLIENTDGLRNLRLVVRYVSIHTVGCMAAHVELVLHYSMLVVSLLIFAFPFRN